MKIAPVRNNNSNVNNARKTSFKGGVDFLVDFWQMIDNGGRAAQFTVEDMFGTNFPRTYKGAMAGYKYTKKINVLALAQEAIREFLTGPTMCLMPVFILGVSKKLLGKSANTHIENIKNLSYLMSQTKFDSKESFDKDFITAVTDDMLKKTIGKDEINPKDTEKLADAILNYKNFTGDKKIKKDLLNEAETTFQTIVKENKDNYSNTAFSDAKYSVSKYITGATKFKNYVDYTVDYANDFTKKYLNKKSIENVTQYNIKEFKRILCGRRAAVIGAMLGITGFAMSKIPKIYTFFSGNTNPNAKEIYNEADKNNAGGNNQ